MSTELKAAELLEKGAEVLDRDGWCKWMLINEYTGQRCAMGALLHASLGMTPVYMWEMPTGWGEHPVNERAMAELAGVVKESVGSPELNHNDWGNIVLWNNSLAADGAEVADAMRFAAKNLRNEAKPE